MNVEALLLVDVGNTRVKWAVAELGAGQPGDPTGGFATTEMSAEQATNLARQFPRHGLVLASVVPKATDLLCKAFLGRICLVSADSAKLGLRFDYPNPAELGADRIAAAVAVHADSLFPAIIVACGTATAFTVLDSRGWLCGGAISPGPDAQLAALLGATAQLRETKIHLPQTALAKSTDDATRAGVVFGFQGGAKEIVAQLIKAIQGGTRPYLILTGGNAHYLQTIFEPPFELRPLLVLEGLLNIGNRTWHQEKNEPDDRQPH